MTSPRIVPVIMPRNPELPNVAMASVRREAGTRFWMCTSEHPNCPASPTVNSSRPAKIGSRVAAQVRTGPASSGSRAATGAAAASVSAPMTPSPLHAAQTLRTPSRSIASPILNRPSTAPNVATATVSPASPSVPPR